MSKPSSKTPSTSHAAASGPATPAPKPGTKVGGKSNPVIKAGTLSATAAPAPLQASNRFSERFAPPKPPARGFPELADIVKTAHKADPALVNAWKTKAGRDLTEPELLACPTTST